MGKVEGLHGASLESGLAAPVLSSVYEQEVILLLKGASPPLPTAEEADWLACTRLWTLRNAGTRDNCCSSLSTQLSVLYCVPDTNIDMEDEGMDE